MTRISSLIFALIACFAATKAAAQIVTGPPDLDKIVQIKLLKGWRLQSGAHMMALQVTLAPEWKTYWRVGGDTGIPPRFDWKRSKNLGRITYHWPRPDIIDVDGLEIIGYKNQLILPIEVQPTQANNPVQANLGLEIGVCAKVCIPVSIDISARLNSGSNEARPLIEQALSEGEIPAASSGLKSAFCTLSKIEDGFLLNAEFNLPTRETTPEVVVFETASPDVWIAPATSHRTGDRLTAQTTLISYAGDAFSLDPKDLRVTVIGKKSAVEIGGCPLKQ
jgi:DsbC/DsbD-like thiol-disulfide interchange protein